MDSMPQKTGEPNGMVREATQKELHSKKYVISKFSRLSLKGSEKLPNTYILNTENFPKFPNGNVVLQI